MKSERILRGPAWHNSDKKRQLDASLASNFGSAALKLASVSLQLLKPHGYTLFTQERIGQNGVPFQMYKIQTMPRTDLPLLARKEIIPIAQMIRDLAFDELVQIMHVSRDPDASGEMSIIGPRPQLPQEIDHMREVMTRAGKKERFENWHATYCAMRPGLFSIESTLDEQYEPNTLEFYEARADATNAYYERANYDLDVLTFKTMLYLGAQRYTNMRIA